MVDSVTELCGGNVAYLMHKGRQAILAVYADATPEEQNNGTLWYSRAHRFARKVAALSGKSTATVCAIIARVSPRISWADNRQTALDISLGRAPSVGYPDNIRRAERISDGDNATVIAEEVLPGQGGKYPRPKISAFYQNILDPACPDSVTVDTWAARIWAGQADGETVTVTVEESARIAEDYRAVATSLRLLPLQLQAVVWLCAHRLHREQGQLSLYNAGLVYKV